MSHFFNLTFEAYSASSEEEIAKKAVKAFRQYHYQLVEKAEKYDKLTAKLRETISE